MKLLGSFLRLIRFPNLAFIALTQLCFYYGIILSERYDHPDARWALDDATFGLLLAASLMIAAGGYVINDYFDINIDSINRPDRQVVERIIKRRWAMIWHILLSFAGLVMSVLVSRNVGNPLPGLFNGAAIALLWFYSTDFKRRLLIGNVIIALLTAWVVLVLYVSEAGLGFTYSSPDQTAYIMDIYKSGIVFGGFAFISSLIREAVKDLEDMEGDARYNCRTMPIVWGIRSTKVYAGVWLIVLIGAVAALAVYFLLNQRWLLTFYLFSTVSVPAIFIIHQLNKAELQKDYARLSLMIKIMMFFGTMTMILF